MRCASPISSSGRLLRLPSLLAALLLVPGAASGANGDDSDRANAYDDAWEVDWVDRCRGVLGDGANKVDGFVLQVGDSITHSNPYSQWPRYGDGKTALDAELFDWSPADTWGNGENDTTSTNGWYLAAADTTTARGMTAATGISSGEYVTGDGNGGPAMPAEADPDAARAAVSDPTYAANLHIETVASAFSAAQFAVVMLGTNDVSGPLATAEFTANLTGIVDTLEARNICVVVSTIPPHYDTSVQPFVDEYNAAIYTLAQSRELALIDYHAEIVARRPDGSWNGTLLGTDNVHPSGSGGGFNSSADPYTPGGDPTQHHTGDAAQNVGYLLRSWLTVQKLKEVRTYVVDGIDPAGGGGEAGEDGGGSGNADDGATTDGDGPGPGPGPSGTTDGPGDAGGMAGAATVSGTGRGTSGPGASDADQSGCSCRTTPRSTWALFLLGALLARRRRTTVGLTV